MDAMFGPGGPLAGFGFWIARQIYVARLAAASEMAA
jgi:hypothetical protein